MHARTRAFVLPRIAESLKRRTVAIVRIRQPVRLTVALVPDEGGALPCEFRLFRAGENDTTKGVFVFDDEAARAVLANAAARGGVDYPIDLEHLSLDDAGRHYDPDARGWFKLAVRNGELWAVDVRWTPDGQRRLSERTQRYVSPAFLTDDEGRVTEIVNVALVAMPATNGTPALVAASRRKSMERPSAYHALAARLSLAQKIIKLAEDAPPEDGGGDGEEKSSAKGASVASAADEAVKALSDLATAMKGGDIDASFAAMETAQTAIDALEKALAAFGMKDDAMAEAAPAPEATAAAPADDTAQKMARMEAELISLRKRDADRAHAEKVDREVKRLAAQRERGVQMVKLGVAPAKVWADESAAKLRAPYAAMDLDALDAVIEALGGTVKLSGPKPPIERTGITDGGEPIELSDYEVARVKAFAEVRGLEHKRAGLDPRTVDEALSRYIGFRGQQLRGAKTDVQVRRYGRRVEQEHVLLSRDGRRMVALASTPVKPIEEFGQSSQRALEEFRMNYNMSLAAEPKTWAEQIGEVLPSGSVTRDTFPINLMAARYVKKTAQGAAAETALNFDVTLTKDEYVMAEEVELRRLLGGDFAYVLSWNQRAARAARARVWLRNQLVTTVLEAGTSGYWGQSTELATGIDGQPFFSASHKVHPRDPSRKLRGVATWGNLQAGGGTAAPLSGANLTAQKPYAYLVADPTGHEFGYEYDTLLVPSSLAETSRNMLTVQDLILDANATLNGVNNATGGGVRNVHHMSGMTYERAPELTGTGLTANWYMVSRAAISAGLPPWLITEDGSEELRTWDESSDLYKDNGIIKVQSHVYTAAGLLFPHGIRKVLGT